MNSATPTEMPAGEGPTVGDRQGRVDARIEVAHDGFDLRLDLAAEPGETIALVGPNGAGKSTTLRCIAGLTPLDAGHLRVDTTTLDEPSSNTWVHPEDRPVSLVFQDHRLFPHLRAIDNIAFALRARGFRRRQARTMAYEHLAAVQLARHLGERRPDELSGGQAQRVALARALATGADVVLLDEPLAAIDVVAHVELRRVISSLAATVIMVTHDPLTARLLADTLVVIEDGRATQHGSADAVARAPATEWAAELLGQNLVEGDADGTTITTASGLQITSASPAQGSVVVNFAPSGVTLSADRPAGSARNVWETAVTAIAMDSDRALITLGAPLPCRASVTPASVERLNLEVGHRVTASVKATDLRIQVR